MSSVERWAVLRTKNVEKLGQKFYVSPKEYFIKVDDSKLSPCFLAIVRWEWLQELRKTEKKLKTSKDILDSALLLLKSLDRNEVNLSESTVACKVMLRFMIENFKEQDD